MRTFVRAVRIANNCVRELGQGDSESFFAGDFHGGDARPKSPLPLWSTNVKDMLFPPDAVDVVVCPDLECLSHLNVVHKV